MKVSAISKLNKKPKKIIFMILLYATVFVLSLSAGMGFCYAYFSANVSVEGETSSGVLSLDYCNNAGTEVQSNILIYKNNEVNLLNVATTKVMPGDELNIEGSIKNTGNINSYVLLKLRVQKTFVNNATSYTYDDITWFKLDGTKITLGSDGKYLQAPTIVAPNTVEVLTDINYSLAGLEINNDYQDQNVIVTLTLEGYQVDAIDRQTYSSGGETQNVYSSIGIQMTHTIIGNYIDVWSDDTLPSDSLDGQGTEASPYLIQSVADLLYFRANCTSNTLLTDYFKITKNLDLNNNRWTPMTVFFGHLDGDGHSIMNLYINESVSGTEKLESGFIREYWANEIKNLIFNKVNININYQGSGASAYCRVGVICGESVNGGKIINCGVIGANTSSSDLTLTMGSSSYACYLAGIVGEVSYSYDDALCVISNCFAIIDISCNSNAQNTRVGGLIGRKRYNVNPVPIIIENSYYIGAISVSGTSSSIVKGLIIATMNHSSEYSNINNCFAISTSALNIFGAGTASDCSNCAYINNGGNTFTKIGNDQTDITLTTTNVKRMLTLRDELNWSYVNWIDDIDNINGGYAMLRVFRK